MSERLTRKEIKRDEVHDTLALVMASLVERRRMLLAGAAGVLALLLVASGVWALLSKRRQNATARLDAALRVAEAPIDAASPAPDAAAPRFADAASRRAAAKERFQALYDDYPHSAAGAMAALYLGRIALEEGQPAEARRFWTEALAQADDHIVRPAVQLALYRLDREEGKAEEVVTALRGDLEAGRSTLPPDVALHELAVTLEALSRNDEARAAYQRLADEYPESPFVTEARTKLRELDAAQG